MDLRKSLRATLLLSMLGLSVAMAGCADNPREAGGGGGKASGATEVGGGVTSASPGGGNVRPDEGTGGGVR
jgi:hypothetical protein